MEVIYTGLRQIPEMIVSDAIPTSGAGWSDPPVDPSPLEYHFPLDGEVQGVAHIYLDPEMPARVTPFQPR